jgi:hypothetical protein
MLSYRSSGQQIHERLPRGAKLLGKLFPEYKPNWTEVSRYDSWRY